MLAAGLDGIRQGLNPGEPRDDLAFMANVASLPRTLVESIDAFTQDPLTAEVFHPAFIHDYCEMKVNEWERSHLEVTDAERAAYLLNL
jgi:glutamine synthetase